MPTRTKNYEQRLCVRVAEAAEILGLGSSRVYALVNSGELPSVRLGGRAIRLPLAQLRAMIDEKVAAQAAEVRG